MIEAGTLACDVTFMLRHPILFTAITIVFIPCVTVLTIILWRMLNMILPKVLKETEANGMIFELIVVDTKEQAESYDVNNTESHKKYVTFVGEGLCGLHHRGQRPNKLTRLHSPLISDYEKRWETEVLIPAMAKEVKRNET